MVILKMFGEYLKFKLLIHKIFVQQSFSQYTYMVFINYPPY